MVSNFLIDLLPTRSLLFCWLSLRLSNALFLDGQFYIVTRLCGPTSDVIRRKLASVLLASKNRESGLIRCSTIPENGVISQMQCESMTR